MWFFAFAGVRMGANKVFFCRLGECYEDFGEFEKSLGAFENSLIYSYLTPKPEFFSCKSIPKI